MDNFNSFDFECRLQDDFFCGNDLDEIKRAIETKLKNDSEFAVQYEMWLEEEGWESWKEFYTDLEEQEENILISMDPNREDYEE